MKKRLMILSVLAVSTVFFLFGCGGQNDANQTQTISAGAEISVQAEEAGKPEETESIEDTEDTGDQLTADQMIIYSVDDNGEIINETVSGKDFGPQDVWDKLVEKGILTEDCKINSISADPETGKMSLDTNTAFGDRLRSMGTAGETEIITCVTRSLMETYGCKAIRVTEEGQTLQTGHAEIDYDITLE